MKKKIQFNIYIYIYINARKTRHTHNDTYNCFLLSNIFYISADGATQKQTSLKFNSYLLLYFKQYWINVESFYCINIKNNFKKINKNILIFFK
jgi:hypothetical protein